MEVTREASTLLRKVKVYHSKAVKIILPKILINLAALLFKDAKTALTLEAKIIVGQLPNIQFGKSPNMA